MMENTLDQIYQENITLLEIASKHKRFVAYIDNLERMFYTFHNWNKWNIDEIVTHWNLSKTSENT